MSNNFPSRLIERIQKLRLPHLWAFLAWALTVLGLIGAMFGPGALMVSALLTLGIGVLGLLVIGILGLRRRRRETANERELAQQYLNMIKSNLSRYWLIERVAKLVSISEAGDASEQIVVQGEANSEPLEFYRLTITPNWNQPWIERRKVVVVSHAVAGRFMDEHVVQLGAKRKTSTAWLEDTLEIIVYFPAALAVGDKFDLAIRIDWPGKYRPLIKAKEVSKFSFAPLRPTITHLFYRVVLPSKAVAIAEPLGFTPSDANVNFVQGRNLYGNWETTLTMDGPGDLPEVGFVVTTE